MERPQPLDPFIHGTFTHMKMKPLECNGNP
jgi:hypothetical protein